MTKDLKNIYKIKDNITIKNLKKNCHFTSSNTDIFSDFINDFSIKYFLIKSNIMLLSNNFNISIYLNILKIIFENINNLEILEKEYIFFKQINIYGIMDKLLNDFRLELLFSENELKKFSEKLKELYYDLTMTTQEVSTLQKVETNCERLNKHSVTGYNKFVGMEQPEVRPVEHALVDDRIPIEIPKKPSCVETGSHTTYKVGQFTDKLDIIINDLTNDLMKIKKIITQLDDIIKINKNISDIKFLETQKNKKEIIFDLLEKIDSFRKMVQEF